MKNPSSNTPIFQENLTVSLQDEFTDVCGKLNCFSELFLLIAGQPDPLSPKVMGTISTFLDDIINRIYNVEKEIETLAFQNTGESQNIKKEE